MAFLDRFRNRTVAFLHDLAMVPLAWFGAFWLRFNLEPIPEPFFYQGLKMLPLVIVIQGTVFRYFGLYRGIWRFASMPDMVRMAKAVLVGVLLIAVAILVLTHFAYIPRSAFPLYALLLLLFLSSPRFIYRWIKDHKLYITAGKRVLIVGAGHPGELLVRDLLRDKERAYCPVVFVDKDRRKKGQEIHGVPVAGGYDDIPQLINKSEIDLILIALPAATSEEMRHIVKIVESSGCPFRTLPKVQDLVSGKVSVKELREVSIEDLLGREQVSLDWKTISEELSGKTILVSGGGGSIGSEICRQIARLGPRALIVLEHSEYNLYAVDHELRSTLPNLTLYSVLGDVGDPVLVRDLFEKYKPMVVFHAAAYKHVPLLENQIRMAAVNNVLATRNLASIADEYGTSIFVMISTDKAVNPSNVMGETKRAAEIYCQTLNFQSNTRYMTVRFGNVLGSAGSVIPLFKKQIAQGGPVTVTHPEITRYFMTIDEATQLILQASVIGKGGEIYVLDMGEPIRIAYLAEQMILLSGKQPGKDIDIVYTGLRPGEKLYEELFHTEEALSATEHPNIMLAASRRMELNHINSSLELLQDACRCNDINRIEVILNQLVPEGRMKNAGEGLESVDSKGAVVYHFGGSDQAHN